MSYIEGLKKIILIRDHVGRSSLWEYMWKCPREDDRTMSESG